MNWDLMNKCEQLFDRYNIKPFTWGDAQKPRSRTFEFDKEEMFWKKIKKWSEKVGKFVCMGTHTSMILRRVKRYF